MVTVLLLISIGVVVLAGVVGALLGSLVFQSKLGAAVGLVYAFVAAVNLAVYWGIGLAVVAIVHAVS